MTYITDEELADLPDNDLDAFVAAERILRDRLEEALSASESGSSDHLTLTYMNNVIALANHFGVDPIRDWERAVPGRHEWAVYRQFAAEVDACTMAIRLASVRHAKEHSVALDSDARTKLRQMLNHIRETVEGLDISAVKKEALFKRINALQEEIDRDRTRYQAFAALMIEACDDVGEAAKRLEPVVRLVERIGSALGTAKRSEAPQPKLPPKKEHKKLEAPKAKNKALEKAFDDEIPF